MSGGTAMHQQLYQQLHQGDESWISALMAEWEKIAGTMQGLQTNLDRELGTIRPDWRGPAADSFYGAMASLVGAVAQAQQTANRAKLALTDAQQTLVQAKEKMPEPRELHYAKGIDDQALDQAKEQQAWDAIYVASEGYGRSMRDIPPLAPEYPDGAPQPANRGAGDLWPEDSNGGPAGGDSYGYAAPSGGGHTPPAGAASGGAAGNVFSGPAGGTPSGSGIPDGPGDTSLAGTPPAAPGSTLPGAPGAPGGGTPGAGGSLPGGAGAGAGGGALPGGGVLGGGGRGGVGTTGRGPGGGRLPGGGAASGGGAGGAPGAGGRPGGGAAPGRAPGNVLGGAGGPGGAGGGSGAAGAGGARGGAGRAGMAPMGMGAGGAGGDKGGSRQGWLREQDDVWGVRRDDVAPGVLGQEPARGSDRDDDER